MGCVNKNSRSFLQLAKKHNLASNVLELVTHKYWIERGSEDSLPSDVYIRAQLGGTQYLESIKAVRDLWKAKYSIPKVFDSTEEYQAAQQEAQKYFPKEAIVHYKNANGKDVIAIKQPVEKLELAGGKVSPVFDTEWHMIPAITSQEEEDYKIIAYQVVSDSEKNVTFASQIIKELNQKVLNNLEKDLQLHRYESRPEGNAATVGDDRQAEDGGLLGESQTRVKGRNGSLRETEEQRVLTPKEIRERNAEDKAALEKLAKEQGRWRGHLIDRLEEKYGKKIGKGSEAFAYREDGGPVIKARTIDPDVEGSYKSIEDALTSIEIHNRLFPETAMKIIGYGEDKGEFNVIIQQPYIEGRYATQEEIDQFIQEKFGAEKDLSVIGDTSFKTAAYLLQDLKPQNVIVKDGKLYVIDGDFYLTEQHKQYLRLQEKQKEAANKEIAETEQIITVAPYFRQSLDSSNKQSLENATKEVMEKANKLAKVIGIEISSVRTIGGTYLGSSELTYQYVIKSNDQQKVDLFAAIMGDLSAEYQDAVIAANDVTKEQWDSLTEDKAIELVYSVPQGTTIEAIEKMLQDLSIDGSSFNFENNVLSITAFSEEEAIEISNKLKDTNYEQREIGYQKSRYLDNERRRAAYQTWLSQNKGTQNRQLDNACSKALAVCEAAARYPEASQKSERLKATQDAAEQWDAEHLGKKKTIEQEQVNLLPITPAETPQQVSLPSYEFFMDNDADITVDAAWKIPLLKELDKQLEPVMEGQASYETFETYKEIAEQMTRILEAKSQEDLLDLESPEQPKQKKQVEQNLTEFEKITQQLNNLQESNELSSSEIRHAAEQLVHGISDIVSEIQKNPELLSEYFPHINTEQDVSTIERKKLISEVIGINNLIEKIKENFDPENNDFDDYDVIMQADLLINNWDAVMYLAADVFAANEGFGIVRNYDKGGFATTDAYKLEVDVDNFNDYHNDAEAVAEEKDEQEHWQVEQRTIDTLYSMSQLVRAGIRECYQKDKEGNTIISKWNIPERVDARKATNSLLRWTQGSLTLEDMIARMTDKATQNPWLNQLIERLSDKSGKETDFQSQFFGVFSKHFQLYSIVLQEDGKYHSMAVNSHPALSETMQTITAQFRIGEHPLFSATGKINAALLGTKDKVGEKDAFSLHKAFSELYPLANKLYRFVNKQYGAETLTEEEVNTAIANLVGVSKIFGYNVTESMLEELSQEELYYMIHRVRFLVNTLDKELQAQRKNPSKSYSPFSFGTDNNIASTLRNFLSPITDTLEDTAVNAFYDSGKMYQSYVTPSYMTKLMNKFQLEGREYEDFIMKEYGNSEWFNTGSKLFYRKAEWRNAWLQWLRAPSEKKKFSHKVELNFNKHNYMRNMSDAEYTLSLITEYFSTQEEGVAWYRIPMQSNKPSSEFLKGPKYEGAEYKRSIVRGLHEVFNQELSRIQTVNMRNHSKNDAEAIKNFDVNGKKFNFLPFLNPYLEGIGKSLSQKAAVNGQDVERGRQEDAEIARLLKRKIEGLTQLKPEEEARLSTLVDQVIEYVTEDNVQRILNEWESNGILEAAKSIQDIYPKELKGEDVDRWVRKQVENFLWNDHFAAMNILQLTITDIAFYKDAEDLQKRMAQLHAPGTRGNVNATDYEGNRVSDGTYRTIILKDFDTFKSNIIANISEVFDRKIAAAPEGQKKQLMALKESLVGKDGKYTKINVTDAQGYSSPASYRKKALIFGRWSRKAEDIYQKLQKGEYNYTDLETAFQPLKPFVYSHLQKNMGVSNAPIQQMPVPFQAKNAEYLLIMADAILQGEELSRPNLLRAVYRVMENSAYDGRIYNSDGSVKTVGTYNGRGIDTVQFESAIKSGLQGRINIHQFLDTVGGEEAAYEYMMEQLYKKGADGNRSNEYNTDTFVHEAPYEDYCLQQEVPPHFNKHSQAHGSQIRMIIPSDLDFYKNPNGDTTAEDNQVFYEWTEPDGTKKKVKADEFRKEYEETIAANISESIDYLSQELHINSGDKKERNIALSKILIRELVSSPRYGTDLILACSVDKETGEFRIPKGDPIQAKRIEQLINSIIKNRVNKQKIAGGPIVQVSNFGTSHQLHIRFNDKNGNLLMTREEYEKNPQKKEVSQIDKFKARYSGTQAGAVSQHLSYEEYVKENQAGIAYFEVFIPIWANEIFEKFSNEDGTINMEALEATDPELLKMVSYRIPTEDKYSCAPMKAVGFMPREAGDAIMLPYELTEIDDSDFDVDKRYVMRKNIRIVRKKKSEIRPTLLQAAMKYKKLSERFKEEKEKGNLSGKSYYEFVKDQVNMFLDDPMRMRHSDNEGEMLMKGLFSIYQKTAYTTEAPTSGRTYRNNKIADMTWAVLTNEMTADKILNPGGFDVPKKMGYMVAAYKNPANSLTWEELQSKSIDELKDLSYQEKDLTWADTQVQFYRQNSAAASLIGVFAVNKVAHATLESNDIQIAVDEICGNEPFVIADTEFGGRMFIDPKYDSQGNLIGKTLGSLVSASADAVKDPILNLMNINMATAGTLNTMLRLGMPFEDAAMFLSQSVVERVLNEFNRENLTNYQSLSAIIDQHLQEYRDKYNITDNSAINREPLTKDEMIEGLLMENVAEESESQHKEATEYKVLLAFQKVRKLTDAIRKPTFATRFNSISSAVGPLIIDNLIMEHKMEQFRDSDVENSTHFYTSDGINVDIDDIFSDHPILKQFSRTVDIAKIMFSDMPTGSTGFRNLLNELPEGLADKVYNSKKLLDDLSLFYQSYLLVASQMVNPQHLKKLINNFPRYFNDQKFKEKYSDNALIQAIRTNVNKRTGRAFLSINITGLDEAQKEVFRSTWIDLHKTNPELSKLLFEYCFFRAGIGFSPKTFMSLVPTYVKERLFTNLPDGSKVSYVDTFRSFPSVNPNLVIDQWVRNNWNNSKLVPKKGSKDTHYQVDSENGRLIVRDAKDRADLTGVTYMKTRQNGQTYLWKLLGTEEQNADNRIYTRIEPLGNNGEYVVMSLDNIQKDPISETKDTIEDIKESELAQTSPQETETENDAKSKVISSSEIAKGVAELADLLMKQNPKFSKEDAIAKIEEMKKNPTPYLRFLVNVFKQKGLNLTKEEALREFKKFC